MSHDEHAGYTIRRATSADSAALARICLLTGDAGSSAENQYPTSEPGPELLALLYALPYVDPALADVTTGLVLARPGDGAVIGYVLCAPDTRAFEAAAERTYWPALATRYPLPAGVDTTLNPYAPEPPEEAALWADWPLGASTPAGRRCLRIVHGAAQHMRAAEPGVAFAPAHLHIDLLPEAQGRGWGACLMAALLAELAARGSNGIWIGLDNRNERARRFYTRLGFQPIDGAPDNYLGLRFENWRGPPFSTVEKLN